MKYFLTVLTLGAMIAPTAFADRPAGTDGYTKAGNSYNGREATSERGDSKGYAANRMVMMKSPDGMNSNTDFSRTFQLTSGGKAMIEGGAIYLMGNNGNKFPAPTGTYNTQNGMDLVAESGMLLRIENEARAYPMGNYQGQPSESGRTRNR